MNFTRFSGEDRFAEAWAGMKAPPEAEVECRSFGTHAEVPLKTGPILFLGEREKGTKKKGLDLVGCGWMGRVENLLFFVFNGFLNLWEFSLNESVLAFEALLGYPFI